MHCKLELRAYSYNNITEYKRALGRINFNRYNLLIFYAVILSVLGSHMYVSLGHDNALFELNFALGAYQFASTATCNVARFTNRSCNAY